MAKGKVATGVTERNSDIGNVLDTAKEEFQILKPGRFSIGERMVNISDKMDITDAKIIAEQHPAYIKIISQTVNQQGNDTEGNTPEF